MAGRMLPQRVRMALFVGFAVLVFSMPAGCGVHGTEDDEPPALAASTVVPTVFPTPLALPPRPATWDRPAFNTMVAAVTTTLPTASPRPGWPPDKSAGDQRNDASARALHTISAAYGIPTVPRDTPVPETTPYTVAVETRVAGAGILVPLSCNSELLYKAYVISYNKWGERVGDHNILVCAGNKPMDQSQGAILVVAVSPSAGIVGGPDVYYTPTQDGWLKIVDAVGERLTLQSNNGTLFYFDVPTRQWVNP